MKNPGSTTTPPLSILHTESSTGWGGQEIRILTEARGMMRRGHRVLILTPANAQLLPAAQKMGIPVEALDIEWKRLASLWAMRRWLKQHGHEFDIINTHSSTDSWLAAVAAATLKQAPALVRTRHVSTPINNHASTRWLYTRATAHIATTGEALRQQLHRDNGYALESMTSVRTGIDLNRYRPLDKQAMRAQLGLDNRPTLGVLATLRDWKGHRDLLDAWVLLRPRFADWRLLIVGDGPERERLEARVDELGLRDSVRLTGNQENVPEWLSALDLLTLPSYGAEGVPQGIMQGMACGVPVVSTTVGAIGEAVQDGKTGFLVAPRNPPLLAEALARLMQDDHLRKTMGEASLCYAREHFGDEVMVDKMEAIFRRCARSRAPRT
ncbi:MAG: glycosyltransferase family 4 protein [Betaproteobacteria bacterium]|nr:glycosyltransferase family 4 protein [Betaproteobacteria bacterium]